MLAFLGVLLCFFLVQLTCAEASTVKPPIKVAVASNFAQAAKAIAQAFERQSDTPVHIISGSTGKLFAQIVHGAPFDVFLSADQRAVSELDKRGLIEPSTRITYAEGRLVFWLHAKAEGLPSLPENSVSEQSTSFARLLQQNHIRRIALPNPRLAPYGRAARLAVDALWKRDGAVNDEPFWQEVYAENVLQTYQFVRTGNADAGFLGLSQVIQQADWQNRGWLIPVGLHPPIYQDGAAIRRHARRNNKAVHHQQLSAATAFMDFLHHDRAMKIMTDYGYGAITPP